jgi:Bacterial Ig domain
MKHEYFLSQRFVFSMAGALLLMMISSVANSAEIALTAPHNGTTVSGTTKVTISSTSNISWSNFYVDGKFQASGHSSWYWNTAGFADGSHTLLVNAYSMSDTQLGTASVNVTVDNSLWSCDTPGRLSGNPLMSDSQAAAAVIPTAKSVVETGASLGSSVAAANAAANSYYYNHGNTSTYRNQLAGFHSYWQHDPIMARVDGACLLGPHPTTGEVLQWAAHKWGFSPLLEYAETTNDGDWNMLHVPPSYMPDYPCSIGVDQVSYCGTAASPHHAIRGLDTGEPGHLLPKESTCFNADLHASFLYRFWTGANGYSCSRGNLPVTIQKWFSRSACTPARFAQRNCSSLTTHNWDAKFFNGSPVPY